MTGWMWWTLSLALLNSGALLLTAGGRGTGMYQSWGRVENKIAHGIIAVGFVLVILAVWCRP